MRLKFMQPLFFLLPFMQAWCSVGGMNLTGKQSGTTLEITSEMRASIDSIKAELANGDETSGEGRLVTRDRQTGKTLALLEFIHEYARGFVYYVTIDQNTAMRLQVEYHRMYPTDEQPIVLSIKTMNFMRVAGRDRCWVTDEVWPGAVKRKIPQLEMLTFLGGVGTPLCMDLHSHGLS